MMNHHMSNGSQVMPAVPLRPGQRQNEYISAPYPGQFAPTPPNGYHQPHPHAQAQPYPPQYYRSWNQPYSPYPVPNIPQYANPPLVVSSYPQSQPTPPVPYQTRLPQPSTPSTHSQTLLSPTNSSTSLNVPTPPLTASTSSLRPTTPPPIKRAPFSPPLPWYSVPGENFPPRARRLRRKRRAPLPSAYPVELPPRQAQGHSTEEPLLPNSQTTADITSSETETPLTSQPPSEADSTHPTTPSSALPPTSAPGQSTVPASRAIVPAVPLPTVTSHSRQSSVKALQDTKDDAPFSVEDPEILANRSPTRSEFHPQSNAVELNAATHSPSSDQTPKPSSPPIKAAPKSWADLVRSNVPKTVRSGDSAGSLVVGSKRSDSGVTTTMSDTLRFFEVDKGLDATLRISFLEPRGLVNTGNMCYMNSVLQVLVFCVPFFGFLDQVGNRVAHSFKSDTPLLDSIIMFMREFRIIDSAPSVEQLRMRLKEKDLEQYGEAFTPDFVYDVIRRLPRFASMRRGHQQDAEEFLGFLLEGLHDECAQVMKGTNASGFVSGISSPVDGLTSPGQDTPTETFKLHSTDPDAGWLEVGPKQKAAVTRSSGSITTESPITKIFGGKLRSELRVPGLKNSVTLEPYQPLQLDIQSPQIKNITDALRGLTRSEVLHGEFNSPRGPGGTATKQVFIESTPPVLILHLKRFHYDNTGGTQKIWKKVGYPLDLEIPKEAFPPHKRGGLVAHGALPRYRLIGVVYHHGKNASGGHYTVDVRRQEGREWIRLDDTVIRRVRSEDVAEGGSEEDSKSVTIALEQHEKDTVDPTYFGDQTETNGEENAGGDQGWKRVSGTSTATAVSGKNLWSKVANGATTPTNVPGRPYDNVSVKDNKVAYILFYQKL